MSIIPLESLCRVLRVQKHSIRDLYACPDLGHCPQDPTCDPRKCVNYGLPIIHVSVDLPVSGYKIQVRAGFRALNSNCAAACTAQCRVE